jgi:hypothetical protein
LTCTTTTTSVSYIWKKDGSAVSGETSNTLTLDASATTQSGTYTCVVTHTGASTTAESAGHAFTVSGE